MASEFYPTPANAVSEVARELERYLPDRPYVLDPGCGNGALGRILGKAMPGLYLHGVELDRELAAEARAWYHRIEVGNYLELPVPPVRAPDLIICNPPFSLIREFVDKSFERSGAHTRMAFLMRIDVLGGQKRHDWWKEMPTQPKLRILSARPSFTGDGNTDNSNYMWVLWGFRWGPALDWYKGRD